MKRLALLLVELRLGLDGDPLLDRLEPRSCVADRGFDLGRVAPDDLFDLRGLRRAQIERSETRRKRTLHLAGLPADANVYAYAITPDWPEIPRWFAFEPAKAFRENIIPLVSGGPLSPPGRDQLYLNCAGGPSDVHPWKGSAEY